MKKFNLIKNYNGITLIALIITIILILILASITVTVAINGGLFGYAKNAKDNTEIANEKEIIKISVMQVTGGIMGKGGAYIKNCCNEGKVEGISACGGIIGNAGGSTIVDCYNKGEIIGSFSSEGYVGGIAGFSAYGTSFLNCYNTKESSVTSENVAGGIVGWCAKDSKSISNCYNLGKIKGEAAGGIIGYAYVVVVCRNCYSTGNMTGTYVGGIVGSALYNMGTSCIFKNCYYLEGETVTKSAGKTVTVDATGLTSLAQEVIDEFNTYIETDPDEIDTTDWLKWELEKNGVPNFVQN